MFNESIVIELSKKYGKTPAQILLRFQIQKGVIVIPKSVHDDRIKENIDIFDFLLNEEEMNALSKLDRNEPMIGNPEVAEFTEKAMGWIK